MQLFYMLFRPILFISIAVFAVTSEAMEVFQIVPGGENAPESLVRIVSTQTLANGRVAVTAMQGPCRGEARNKTDLVIHTTQKIAKGDLFFKVPSEANGQQDALRRATVEEVEMYERCRWR